MRGIATALLSLVAAASLPAQSVLPINVEVIKKSVVFLYGADAAGQPDLGRELATGFLVEIPLKADPGRSYKVLVTARHVVDPEWACKTDPKPPVLYARVNRKAADISESPPGVEFVKLLLEDKGKSLWTTHLSNRVDAAVIPIESAKFFTNDVTAIKLADFGGPEEVRSVSIGEDIVSAGLIPGLSGRKRNYPFFKFGKISNIPDEEGLMPCGSRVKPAAYWYIAATLVNGTSGSPIFLLRPARPFLLGLQSMSLLSGEIAGMVPVQYIFEIIESLHLPDADLTRGRL